MTKAPQGFYIHKGFIVKPAHDDWKAYALIRGIILTECKHVNFLFLISFF